MHFNGTKSSRYTFTCADPEGAGGPNPPPEKLQKYRVV